VKLFQWRHCLYRNRIILRLMDDPSLLVAGRASFAAAQTGDPDMLDALASREHWGSLGWAGDPRSRSHVDKLVRSEDPLDWEEGVAKSFTLKDRDLISMLLKHRDWQVRSSSILSALRCGLVTISELEEMLTLEDPESIAWLAVLCFPEHAVTLPVMAQLLNNSIDGFPSVDSIVTGREEAIDRARTWIPAKPMLTGAMIQLFPYKQAVSITMEMLDSHEPNTRQVGIKVAYRRRLKECYPRLAELCLDPDKSVTDCAFDALSRGGIACGVYGMDTAVLKAGNHSTAGHGSRRRLTKLLENILQRRSGTG